MSVVCIPIAFCVWPTAVHTWLVPQDAPLSMFCPTLTWLGVDRRVHVVPSQTSASVRKGPKLPVWYCPTAVHALAEVHPKPFKTLPMDSDGLGVGWMVHADPFHTSARVSGLP